MRGNLSIQSCVVDCLKQFIQECNTLGLSVLKVVQVPNVFDPLINYLFSNSPQIPLTNNTTLNYLETIKALLHVFLSYRSQLTRRLVLGFQLVSIPFKCQNEQLYTDHQDNHLFFEPNKYNLLDTSLPQVKRDELSEQYFAQISSLLSPLCQLLEGETVLLTRVLGEKASTRQGK